MPRDVERVVARSSPRRLARPSGQDHLKAKFFGRKPCCSACRSSWATLRTFSRRIRLNRCTSTVLTLISRRRAISLFVLPCDTSFRISFCRGVSPSARLPAGLIDAIDLAFLVVRAALVGFVGFFVLADFFERICLRGAIKIVCPKFYC